MNTHAIGDAANRKVLDAYQVAFGPGGGAAHRFRVEHAQVLSPSDVPRFARLGVIPSMQPTHCTSDMYWAEARLGPERAKGAYLWKTFLDAGVKVAGGSDAPVENVAVLPGIYAAVTRQDAKGWPVGGWHPGERVTVEDALRCSPRAPPTPRSRRTTAEHSRSGSAPTSPCSPKISRRFRPPTS